MVSTLLDGNVTIGSNLGVTWVPGQDAISRHAADQARSDEAPPELTEVAGLLRQARIDQGISQGDLAQRLHMGLQQLQALEQADRAALPEPVFVIAQARRVAGALGLEIGDAIERLRQCQSFGSQGPALRPEAFARSAPPKSSAAAPGSAPVAAPPAPARTVGSGTVGSTSAGTRAARWTLLVALGVGISIAAWQLQRQPTPVQTAVRPAPPAVAAPELVLQARQPSWLEVRSQRGGAVLFRGTLVGERRFALGQGLRVLAGRPDRVLVSQGSSAPQVLGPISAVRWFSFGADLKR